MLRQYVESRVVPLFVAPAHRRRDVAPPAARRGTPTCTPTSASWPPASRPCWTRSPAFDHVRTHGDATPHNLLVPRAAPEELVVIDWAMGAFAPAGEELGQLLLGAGPRRRPRPATTSSHCRDVVVPAYTAGLADEGLDVSEGDVRLAMDTAITLRSAFSGAAVERLGEPVTDELAALVARRLALTRHLVDVGLTLERTSAVSGRRGGT